ncbi:DEKNAAC101543 [Brettanomyces naardenensis]|uniref:DEKNAAC101543 n=1 Tax=Brettanomyces naardenensis TaxID=13370 RepID=A0A448YIF0_BRENA|nr:DEKNAAC101543 [Brettanomyces naardenensis]
MVDLKIVPITPRRIHNHTFPVAYHLSGPASQSDVEQLLKAKSEEGFFNSVLKEHGAIVLRLGNPDPAVLSTYIKIIGKGSGDSPFQQIGSTAQRTQITDILTNANESSPELEIFQHNEFSRFNRYPTKLYFACSKYEVTKSDGGEGKDGPNGADHPHSSVQTIGQTPLVHGRELFDALQQKVPLLITELSKRGLYMEQVWKYETDDHTGWTDKYSFGRDILEGDSLEQKKKKAEPLIAEYVSKDFHWDPSTNDLIVGEHTQPLRTYENESESYGVSFNSIPTFYAGMKYKKNSYGKTRSISYDDGGEISEYYLDTILETSRELEYNHEWEEGDIVIVDNYQVSHGRKPWKGVKKVLVSMWDKPSKAKFEGWTKVVQYLGMRDAPLDVC